MGSVIPATAAHAAELAPRLREADVAEVRATAGYAPLEALERSLLASTEAYALLLGGELAGLFGVVGLEGTVAGGYAGGVIWLLGSDAIPLRRRAFLSLSRRMVAEFRTRYPVLFNYVDARNEASLRWLRWLGFEIAPAAPFGVEGRPFHHVAIGGSHV